MLIIAIACLGISFILSYILSYFLFKGADILRIGKRVYAERVRLHKKGVPRLGGIAIYVSVCVTALSIFIFKIEYLHGYERKLAGIFLASSALLVCGLYDDLIKRVGYKIKFVAQILAVLVISFYGYNIDIITNPFGGKIYVGVLGIFALTAWVFTIVNAINLLDGLDGLACGISTIISCSLFIITFYQGDAFSIILISAVIGASIAFLRYNFYPAKLFLGDSGSMFLGLMLAALAIEGSVKRSAVVSLAVPLLTLFIPIGSVIFTFSRRIAAARNPFKPDKWHLHYRIFRSGISHRDTVLIFYTVTLFCSILGVLCFFMPKKYELAIITFAGLAVFTFYLWTLYLVNKARKTR